MTPLSESEMQELRKVPGCRKMDRATLASFSGETWYNFVHVAALIHAKDCDECLSLLVAAVDARRSAAPPTPETTFTGCAKCGGLAACWCPIPVAPPDEAKARYELPQNADGTSLGMAYFGADAPERALSPQEIGRVARLAIREWCVGFEPNEDALRALVVRVRASLTPRTEDAKQ